MISPLLRDIDRVWHTRSVSKVRLRVIGSTALMLQTDYIRGTKDSDVLETAHVSSAIRNELERLAGQGTDLHKKHRLYVDVVSAGLPFLPQPPVCHLLHELNASLDHFEIEVMDVVDVVVSKLKRFNTNDSRDIDEMVSRDLVPHALLIERFKAAVDHFEMDARAEDLPRYLENFHTVERDMLVVSETDIRLPSWL